MAGRHIGHYSVGNGSFSVSRSGGVEGRWHYKVVPECTNWRCCFSHCWLVGIKERPLTTRECRKTRTESCLGTISKICIRVHCSFINFLLSHPNRSHKTSERFPE